MELRKIFDQLTSIYGRPTPVALLKNDMLFRSVYSPQDAPEVLFRQSEDCQEVQILGNDPYTPQQLLNNAMPCYCSVASTSASSMIGTANPPQ